MTRLLVDVGNSRVKWARQARGALGEQRAAVHGGWSPEDWRAALFEGEPVTRVVAVCVAGDATFAALDAAARAAQAKEVTRLGGTRPRKVNVRVLTATHHNLSQDVAKGTFRADLLYRIRVSRIQSRR